MAGRLRIWVLVLVLAAAGALLLRSYWPQREGAVEPPGEEVFQTTKNPVAAIETALQEGRPLLIEFYSDR
jgi:thiol:disulfide interchange protein